MVTFHVDGEAGFYCKDFTEDVAVAGSGVFDGGWRTVGETAENSRVVHVLVDSVGGNWMAVGMEVVDSGLEQVESTKVAIGFCAKSACWLGSGVAGEKGVHGGEGLNPAGVGSGETSDGAVGTKVEIAGLDCVEKVGGVGGRLRKDMAEDPLFVGWTRTEEDRKCGDDRGFRRRMYFSGDVG